MVEHEWTPEARETMAEVRVRLQKLFDELSGDPAKAEVIAQLPALLADSGGPSRLTVCSDGSAKSSVWGPFANTVGSTLAGAGLSFLVMANFMAGAIALLLGGALLTFWGGWLREGHVHAGR